MQIECFSEFKVSFERMILGEVYLSIQDDDFYMKIDVYVDDCNVESRLLSLRDYFAVPKSNDIYNDDFIPVKASLRID